MSKCPCCGSALEPLFFDRSDPLGIAVITSKGEHLTYLQHLRLMVEEHGYAMPRNDICLINLPNGNQVCAYPGKDGNPTGEAIKYLSAQEKQRLWEINANMLKVLKEYPEWKWYFH